MLSTKNALLEFIIANINNKIQLKYLLKNNIGLFKEFLSDFLVFGDYLYDKYFFKDGNKQLIINVYSYDSKDYSMFLRIMMIQKYQFF